ncbi:carboxypeptidase-like regulatory domain-containing protein [Pedobacter sp. P26]|uniref:carboxypeptidase-like regulatory domain-containing protein n=1 Tax=Pedobacter sp. P26 TaxID=3423956 RepID=UPI003D6785E0
MRRKVLKGFLPKFFTIKTLAFLLIVSISLPAMASLVSVKTGIKRQLREIVVTGTVTTETGATFPGVAVKIKGTEKAVQTDAKGKFSISVAATTDVLVFSYVGYTSQEQTVGDRTTINVQLGSDTKTLNELVVVGYGTQKKATLTGSISQVKGADLVKSPQPNLSNSLAGRFSGVIVNNRSGEPGVDGSTITVRGLLLPGAIMY